MVFNFFLISRVKPSNNYIWLDDEWCLHTFDCDFCNHTGLTIHHVRDIGNPSIHEVGFCFSCRLNGFEYPV